MQNPNIRFAATIVAALFATLVFTTVPANAADTPTAVITGQYRCPGNFPGGLFHSMTMSATDLGPIRVETTFGNLDAGDCTPRGNQARTVVASFNQQGQLSCAVITPIYLFQPGGGPGSAFDFVCRGDQNKVRDFIEAVSTEILRPTQ